MERKYINNFKLTAATAGTLLALLNAGCAEKKENGEIKAKETTSVTTQTTKETTETMTTYTQTLKTTEILKTTLPVTTTKIVTTTVKPNYNQTLKTTKETYIVNTETQKVETKTEATKETMPTVQTTYETTKPTSTIEVTKVEESYKATLEQINYAYDYLMENDRNSLVRMMNVQDTCAIFKNFKIDGNLTKEIERNFGMVLSGEEKERYDTLFEKTGEKYKECEYLYETLKLDEANKLFEELITNKEYVNIDDIAQMYIYATNGYLGDKSSFKTKKYKVKDNAIVFANGFRINNLLPEANATDFNDPFSVINYFNENNIMDKENEELVKSYCVCTLLPNLIRNISVGIDTKTTEFYTFTQEAIEKEYTKSKNDLLDNHAILFWKEDYSYDQQSNPIHFYMAYDEDGDKMYCAENTKIYEEILNCDTINIALNKAHDYRNFDYNYSNLSEILKNQNNEKELQYTK